MDLFTKNIEDYSWGNVLNAKVMFTLRILMHFFL